MKKLITLLSLLLVVTVSFAQGPPYPSAPIVIDNKTDCELYVKVHEVNGTCSGAVTTHHVHPNSTITVTPASGYWVEVVSVSEDIPPNPADFNERLQVPWASCPFGYNATETDASTNCGTVTATLGGDPSAPELTIFN
ncbi:MAG: hypothetical protein ACI8ZM_001967 [Crocinitomix sp.]|jgi:hypothetical protein